MPIGSRVALAFPNTYYVGMSNLGFQTVYHLFNAEHDTVCERIFLPPKQQLKEQLASRVASITLESQTPVAEFDVLAFSVWFEWDYTNILTMLRLAGIPVRARDRTERHPLIVDRRGDHVRQSRAAGALCRRDCRRRGRRARSHPSVRPSGEWPVGTRSCARWRESGLYIPSFYDVTYQDDGTIDAGRASPWHRRAPDRSEGGAEDRPTSWSRRARGVFTPDTEFGSRFLVEVVRGCANLCRFCWAGYNYLPVRAFPARADPRSGHGRRASTPRKSAWCRSRCATARTSTAFSRGVAEMGYCHQPGFAAARRPPPSRLFEGCGKAVSAP